MKTHFNFIKQAALLSHYSVMQWNISFFSILLRTILNLQRQTKSHCSNSGTPTRFIHLELIFQFWRLNDLMQVKSSHGSNTLTYTTLYLKFLFMHIMPHILNTIVCGGCIYKSLKQKSKLLYKIHNTQL